MVKRVNHKSANDTDNSLAMRKNYAKEVSKGWMIPIEVEALTKLKFAQVIPIGVHVQWNIDGEGQRKVKR